MLSIEEFVDICKEHNVFAELSYLNIHDDARQYMIILRYNGRRRHNLLDISALDQIFANRESFEKYVCEFLEEVKEKEAQK